MHGLARLQQEIARDSGADNVGRAGRREAPLDGLRPAVGHKREHHEGRACRRRTIEVGRESVDGGQRRRKGPRCRIIIVGRCAVDEIIHLGLVDDRVSDRPLVARQDNAVGAKGHRVAWLAWLPLWPFRSLLSFWSLGSLLPFWPFWTLLPFRPLWSLLSLWTLWTHETLRPLWSSNALLALRPLGSCLAGRPLWPDAANRTRRSGRSRNARYAHHALLSLAAGCARRTLRPDDNGDRNWAATTAATRRRN